MAHGKHWLTVLTGYSPSAWSTKLMTLYNQAKRRHGGNSLTIYRDVSDLLDLLDNVEQFDTPLTRSSLAEQLDNLAGRLRRE